VFLHAPRLALARSKGRLAHFSLCIPLLSLAVHPPRVRLPSGLDGATTLDIVRALKGWCVSSHGSATVSLLQANPAVVAQFDQVILMREGCIVFSGSQEQLQQHLADMRITPNPDVDLADWSGGEHRAEQTHTLSAAVRPPCVPHMSMSITRMRVLLFSPSLCVCLLCQAC
jgi:hypothetical protein